MGKQSTKQIGDAGEEFAARYLEQKGYKILKCKYRSGRGEIDIIAEKDNTLVFVEVKSQKHGDFGDPIYWVTRNKQRQIGRIAQAYLLEHETNYSSYQFDVIALRWVKGTWDVQHIENAFWL